MTRIVGRHQYRPMSLRVTFMHTAWLDLRFVEFSVWRMYKLAEDHKTSEPEPWTFRINIWHGHIVIDLRKARSWWHLQDKPERGEP